MTDKLKTDVLEAMLAEYRYKKGDVKVLEQEMKELKDKIVAIMEENGLDSFEGEAGVVSFTNGSQTVSYDWKALDAIIQSFSGEIRNMLLPHRKVSNRAGSWRISDPK